MKTLPPTGPPTGPPAGPATPTGPDSWPEALATVTACTYPMRVGRALAFGMPSSRHFRIAYNYWAAEELHSGVYFSATAVPQGSLFSLRYDPSEPGRNTHGDAGTGTAPSPRRVQLLLAIAGSFVLSLAWLLVLHSCH